MQTPEFSLESLANRVAKLEAQNPAEEKKREEQLEQQRLAAEQAREEGERKQAAAKKARLDQEERECSVRTFGTVIHALTRALKPQSALLIAGIVGAILVVGWLIYRGPSNSSKTPGAVSLTLRGHTNLVCGVAYSPDGKRLATPSGEKTAKVWDAER